jgi:hypothetical protein
MIARVNMMAVRAALAARAAEVAIGLCGQPNRRLSNRDELRFGRKGSLVITLTGSKAGLWFDHETGVGGDPLKLIMHERGLGFLDAADYAERFVGQIHRQQHTTQAIARISDRSDSRADSLGNHRRALELWHEALPDRSLIDSYLVEDRGLSAKFVLDIDPASEVLRFHPSCSYGGMRHPCLLALFRDIHTNEPRAIQRIALTPDGRKIGCKTLGPKTGAAIKLSSDEDVAMGLAVGEGVETILAGMQFFDFRPAWACGDVTNLESFPVLSGIECLTIFVDHDESGRGQRAALECSDRWTATGREVIRLIPRRTGEDLNDVIRRRRREAP